MWHSSFDKINYPRKNYSKNGVTVFPGPLSSVNFSTITSLPVTGNISKGHYGNIKMLGSTEKYVMKTMNFDSPGSDLLKIFFNEIRVGRDPKISQVGPRIYAWRILRDREGFATDGQYIMDSFTGGDKSLDAVTLARIKMCPLPNDPLYPMLRKTIEKFWKITKGFHGDLHGGNIAAVYDKKSRDIKKFMIFDYGSHKKFKTTTNDTTCFEDFIRIIDKEFHNRLKKPKTTMTYVPVGTKIHTIVPKRSQPRRSNIHMLKSYTFGGQVLNKHFSNSLMSRMRPQSPARHISNITASGRNVKKMNHTHAFVSPTVFKNMKKIWEGPRGAAATKIQKAFRKYHTPTWG